jgi:hypothetical protein
MPVLCHGLKWTPNPVEYPVPTATALIPHILFKITEAMQGDLLQDCRPMKMWCAPGSSDCLPCLIFEHLVLQSFGFPTIVEIAEKTTVFTIDAPREPGAQ